MKELFEQVKKLEKALAETERLLRIEKNNVEYWRVRFVQSIENNEA